MSCLLRSCISQKCGHLLRAAPPYKTAKLSADIDERLIAATGETFKLEFGDHQKELLFILASRGGWGLNSLSNANEVAYIAGVAATPIHRTTTARETGQQL